MSVEAGLTAYLSRHFGAPVRIEDLHRIPGGASRETYRFNADVQGTIKKLILRRDPVGSLIDTDRRLEFLACQSFFGKGVYAPEALILDEAGQELERPFFIMERIEGGAASSPFSAPPYDPHAARIGEQFFSAMGKIAGTIVEGLPFTEIAPAPALDQCWSTVLDYWEGVLDEDELHPQPIMRAAIRRLRANPPPPAQKLSVVHGDYRTGNFMHDGQGEIVALLDWEMAHLGDPLEDLGWAIAPLWSYGEKDRVSGMLPRAEAFAIWEAASGLKVDPAAMAWWELFASVKGQGIWVSSAREFRDGGLADPVLGFSGWYTARREDLALSGALERFAEAHR
jgi:aminoglycoside phosphotransferase (APT) family kinase protein